MLKNYLSHVAEREALGIPPLPLDAKQTKDLTELLEKPEKEADQNFLLDLLVNRIPPGVDQASYVKATWLSSIAQEESKSPLVNPLKANLYELMRVTLMDESRPHEGPRCYPPLKNMMRWTFKA